MQAEAPTRELKKVGHDVLLKKRIGPGPVMLPKRSTFGNASPSMIVIVFDQVARRKRIPHDTQRENSGARPGTYRFYRFVAGRARNGGNEHQLRGRGYRQVWAAGESSCQPPAPVCME